MDNSSLANRSHFPSTSEWVYLNQAAIGLIPLPVQDAIAAFDAHVTSNGTINFDDAAEAQAVEGPRSVAAALIGANPEDVAITTNATEVINQFAWMLRPKRPANVVSIDIEFPSVLFPWIRLAEETGVELRLLDARVDPADVSLDNLAALVDNNTEVICVSHVQYATGHLLDPAHLRALADSVGAVLILDATQSAGVVPVNVASGVDVLFSSGYKWLCGPCGAAFSYVNPSLRDRLRPVFVGWRSVAQTTAPDVRRPEFARTARVLEGGTPSYTAAVGMAAGIEYLLDLGIDRVANHVRRLSDYLIERLEALGGELVTPRESARRAGVISVRYPGFDAADLCARAYEKHVVMSARLGAVRFAIHAYNNEEDIDRAVDAVAEALLSGSRR